MVPKLGGLVLLLIFLWLFFSKQAIETNNNAQKNQVTPQKLVVKKPKGIKSEQKKEKFNVEPISKPSKTNKLTDDQAYRLEMLMKEIAYPEYSDDPYIEVSLQSLGLLYCESVNVGFLRTELKGRIKNSLWEKQYKKHCNDKKQQHPQLFFTSFMGEQSDWIPASSSWGQLLKDMHALPYEKRHQKGNELMLIGLKNQKPHLLMLSSANTSESEVLKYGYWLGTQNKKYQDRVVALAVESLVCEWDPEGLCGPYSVLTATRCSQTPNDCGMPFHEWFEKNHMPGVKKDVAIVVNNLKAYSQGEDIE